MKFLKLTLSAKLISSYVLMIAIIGIFLGITLLNINKINAASEQSKDKFHRTEYVLNMKYAATATMDVFADMVIGQDPEVYSEISHFLDYFETNLESYRDGGDSAELAFADELDSLHEFVDLACNDGHDAAVAGDFELVLEILEERVESSVTNLDSKIEEALADMKVDVKEAEESTNAAISNTSMMGMIVGVAGVLIGILSAILILASIRNPLNKLVDAATLMGDGDFTKTLQPSPVKDEIGKIIDAFSAMSENMRGLIQQVSKAATSVASSSEELAAGADEAGKAIQEVASTVSEMAKGSQNAVRNTGSASENLNQNAMAIEGISRDIEEVAGYATTAATQGNEGKKNADDAAAIIARAADSVRDTTAVVHSLGEKTNQIGEFIGIITGIADQTNLLALNAAIEAARAGDAGRGFAVVAEEVRKLAEESNGAAGNITTLVKGIESEMQNALTAMERSDKEVSEGSTTVNQASQKLEEIVHGVEALNEKVQNISASAEEINASTGEIVGAITAVASEAEESAASAEEVSASTEEQTASMEEIASNASNLASLAQDLQELVSKFKV